MLFIVILLIKLFNSNDPQVLVDRPVSGSSANRIKQLLLKSESNCESMLISAAQIINSD